MSSSIGSTRERQYRPVSHNSNRFAVIISSAVLLLWSRSAHPIRVVDALRASRATRRRRVAAASGTFASLIRLHGVSEWREKFSGSTSANSDRMAPPTTTTTPSRRTGDGDALPLLLLPFAPSQILIPGQSTTLRFRHGRYMDLIDESMTSYESVLGISVLGEDGPLPHAVLCEVLGDELEVNAGYRGFSSMEVGIRAVGRARRAAVGGEGSKGGHVGDPAFRGRTTISDDIHLGRFVEWHDAAMTGDDLEMASEYSRSIEGILNSGARQQSDYPGTIGGSPREPHDEKARRRRMLFDGAYEANLEHSAASPHPATTGYSDGRRRLQAHLMAISWASLAACDDLASPSIITRALVTDDTVERLRLGLAAMLDSRIPREENNAGEVKNYHSNNEGDDSGENSFQ